MKDVVGARDEDRFQTEPPPACYSFSVILSVLDDADAPAGPTVQVLDGNHTARQLWVQRGALCDGLWSITAKRAGAVGFHSRGLTLTGVSHIDPSLNRARISSSARVHGQSLGEHMDCRRTLSRRADGRSRRAGGRRSDSTSLDVGAASPSPVGSSGPRPRAAATQPAASSSRVRVRVPDRNRCRRARSTGPSRTESRGAILCLGGTPRARHRGRERVWLVSPHTQTLVRRTCHLTADDVRSGPGVISQG